MPTLDQWPDIIALAATTCLSVPEAGHQFPVHTWATGRLDATPCGLVQLGGPAGTFVDMAASGGFATVCSRTATITLWLMLADAPSDASTRLLLELTSRLLTVGLASAATDPLNVEGFVPAVERIDSPGLIEFGSRLIWAASVPFTVPFQLHP